MRSSRTVRKDLRESPEYAAVAEHLGRLHESAFGRPHHVTDLVTATDASRGRGTVDAAGGRRGRGGKISPDQARPGRQLRKEPVAQGGGRSTSMWHCGPVARASLPSPVSRLTSSASASATYDAS